MTKTILIPVDLRIASLNTLKVVLSNEYEAAPRVILLYAEHLTDSITELLFYSPEKFLESRLPDAFEEAIEILKSRFGKRSGEISIELFHGRTTNALRHFLEAQQVYEVFIPQSYRLETRGRAFDPIPMLKKTGIPVTEVAWTTGQYITEQDQLISLFN